MCVRLEIYVRYTETQVLLDWNSSRGAHEPPRSPQISRCGGSPASLLGNKFNKTSMAVINAKSSVANATAAWHESYSHMPPAACKGRNGP
jgi:hypothetical protein